MKNNENRIVKSTLGLKLYETIMNQNINIKEQQLYDLEKHLIHIKEQQLYDLEKHLIHIKENQLNIILTVFGYSIIIIILLIVIIWG
jgi:cytochrome oxidase assembly protein ShyY1